jgi:hypothetical protein
MHWIAGVMMMSRLPGFTLSFDRKKEDWKLEKA